MKNFIQNRCVGGVLIAIFTLAVSFSMSASGNNAGQTKGGLISQFHTCFIDAIDLRAGVGGQDNSQQVQPVSCRGPTVDGVLISTRIVPFVDGNKYCVESMHGIYDVWGNTYDKTELNKAEQLGLRSVINRIFLEGEELMTQESGIRVSQVHLIADLELDLKQHSKSVGVPLIDNLPVGVYELRTETTFVEPFFGAPAGFVLVDEIEFELVQCNP